MNIPIPEDLEHRLQSHLCQLCQRALEAYANCLMSAAEVQALLQLPDNNVWAKGAIAFLEGVSEDGK